MEETIKEVLIKECGEGLHDKVIIIENLPRKFIYEQTPKRIPRIDKEGYTDGTLVNDPKGELVWTLLPGLEASQTGDNGIMFWKSNQESANRLKDIDRYVDRSLPRDARIPERANYGQQIGNPMAGPIPYSQIPRIVLPAPIKEVNALPPPVEGGRKNISPDKLEQMRERARKARESKRSKVEVPA